MHGARKLAQVDYSKYTLTELYEALASIDAEKYPENYQRLVAELNRPERNESQLIVESEKAQEKANELKSFKFTTLVGVFFVFGSYLAYEQGVIYQRHSDQVLASIDSDPASFLFLLGSTVLLGICLIIFGLFNIYKLSEEEKG